MKNKTPQPIWWRHSTIAWQQLEQTLDDISQSNASGLSTTTVDYLNLNNWSKVIGGLTNTNYRLNLQTQSLLIQVVNPDNLAQLPGGHFCRVNQILSEQPLLSQWLKKCWFESESIRIFDWIEIPTASTALFQQECFVKTLSQFLVNLHGANFSLPVLNIETHLNRYYQSALAKHPQLKEKLLALLNRALLLAQYFSATNICHNDLSPGNLLFKKNLIVIDWEYASIGDPLFDLAGLSINFKLNFQYEKNLILNYSEKSCTKFDFEKFNKMKQLYLIIEQLWSYINNAQN